MHIIRIISWLYIVAAVLLTIAALAAYRPPSLSEVHAEQSLVLPQEVLQNNDQKPSRVFHSRETRIVWGSNLLDTLKSTGLTYDESLDAVKSLESLIDMRKLQTGQKVFVDFSEEQRPLRVRMPIRYNQTAVAIRDDNGWRSENEIIHFQTYPIQKSAQIETSLFETAVDSDIPISVMMDAIELFSFEFDFQREIQAGDLIELYYPVELDGSGKRVASGELIFARLTSGERSVEAWRYKRLDGEIEYYESSGESIRKALIRTPVNGARLTSGFGMRMHPILGYTAFHRGIDFAVPIGTPIKASGDGVIMIAGWHKNYGNRVKIRHANHYETLYAHLSSIKSGIVPGASVKQGSIVGWSGSSGMSTGPHCHYEVHYYGKPVDPTRLKFPPGHHLGTDDLEIFKRQIEIINASMVF